MSDNIIKKSNIEEAVKENKLFGLLKVNMSEELIGVICLDGENVTDKVVSLTYEYKVIDGIKSQNVLVELYGGLSYKIDTTKANRVEIDSSINSKDMVKKNKK